MSVDHVLVDARFFDFRNQIWKMMVLMSAMFIFTVAVIFWILSENFPDGKQVDYLGLLAGFGARLVDKPDEIIQLVVMLFVMIMLCWYAVRAEKYERLIVTEEGIRYLSPLPSWMKSLREDWFMRWDEIERVGIVCARSNHRIINLKIQSAHKKSRTLNIVAWVNPKTYRPTLFKRPDSIFKRPDAQAMLSQANDSELGRLIAKYSPGIKIVVLDYRASGMDLTRSRFGKQAVAVVALLLAYGLIDFIALPETYVEPLALQVFVFIGLAAGLISLFWLRRSDLERSEKIGLSVLIGILAGFAAYPGLLRINMIGDDASLVAHPYVITIEDDAVVLLPSASDKPVIEYFRKDDYWVKRDGQNQYNIYLRKGGLGFYQFSVERVLEDMRASQHQ